MTWLLCSFDCGMPHVFLFFSYLFRVKNENIKTNSKSCNSDGTSLIVFYIVAWWLIKKRKEKRKQEEEEFLVLDSMSLWTLRSLCVRLLLMSAHLWVPSGLTQASGKPGHSLFSVLSWREVLTTSSYAPGRWILHPLPLKFHQSHRSTWNGSWLSVEVGE